MMCEFDKDVWPTIFRITALDVDDLSYKLHHAAYVFEERMVVLGIECALYRSERALARAGYPIARSTLCVLFHRTAEQLAPLYDEMRNVVRGGRYVHADETGQPMPARITQANGR
jgi:hypothetical protein